MQSESYVNASTFKPEPEESWVADLDPILEGGFKVVFQLQFSIEMRRIQDNGNSIGVKDIFMIRVITRNGTQGIAQIKLELSSEKDIFTVYLCKIDEKKFDRMKKLQSLNFSFQNLLPMLIKQITLCDKNLTQYSAVFYSNKLSSHRLDFIQNIEYKRIELISFDFQELDNESIKNYVTYRFTKIKTKNLIMENRLKDVLGIVKLKNPNMLGNIIKKITGQGSGGSNSFIR